jgi:hypothetical protein
MSSEENHRILSKCPFIYPSAPDGRLAKTAWKHPLGRQQQASPIALHFSV